MLTSKQRTELRAITAKLPAREAGALKRIVGELVGTADRALRMHAALTDRIMESRASLTPAVKRGK